MADIVGTSYNQISTAQSTLRTLYPSANSSVPEKKLTSDLNGNAFATHRSTIGINDSQIMVKVGVVSAVTILRSLEYMLQSVELAAHGGLVSTSTALTDGDGTRISRVNIQSALNRTVKGINNVVNSLGSSTTNLLSSSSFDLSFRTTKYGGSISVSPQPLDAAGLNIENLNIMDANSLADARNRIRKAIETTQSRLFNLQSLESALTNHDALAANLAQYNTRSSGSLGTFVNLSA